MKKVPKIKVENFGYIPEFLRRNKRTLGELKNDCLYFRLRFNEDKGLEELKTKCDAELEDVTFYAETKEIEIKHFGMC